MLQLVKGGLTSYLMGNWDVQLWTEIITIYKNSLPFFFNSKSILLLYIATFFLFIVVSVPLNNHHFYKYFRFIILTSSLHRITSQSILRTRFALLVFSNFYSYKCACKIWIKEETQQTNKQTRAQDCWHGELWWWPDKRKR